MTTSILLVPYNIILGFVTTILYFKWMNFDIFGPETTTVSTSFAVGLLNLAFNEVAYFAIALLNNYLKL